MAIPTKAHAGSDAPPAPGTPDSPRRRGRTSRQRDRLVGFLAFLPLAVIMLALAAYPIYWIVTRSFLQQGLFSTESAFVGFDNFQWVFTSSTLPGDIGRSLVFAGGSLLLQLPVAMLLAHLLNERFFLRNFAQGSILFTFLIPYVVAALTFRFMLNEATGVLNYYISASNLPIPASIFGDPDYAMAGVIVVNSWKNFPLILLVFLGVLKSIDTEMLEAANIDGAGRFNTFRFITLPQMIPVGIVITMLRFIWNFNNFEVVHLLTQGGPLGRTRTVPILLYRVVFGEMSIGRGAALAVVTMGFLTILAGLMVIAGNRVKRRYE